MFAHDIRSCFEKHKSIVLCHDKLFYGFIIHVENGQWQSYFSEMFAYQVY